MDPHTGVLPGLKVMVDRAKRWKFAWQQSPLAASPQEVKDGVEGGTKVRGARSPARSRRRQNRGNPGPRRVGQGLFLNRCQVLQVEQLAGLPAQHKQENDKDEPKRQNRPAWLENIYKQSSNFWTLRNGSGNCIVQSERL